MTNWVEFQEWMDNQNLKIYPHLTNRVGLIHKYRLKRYKQFKN